MADQDFDLNQYMQDNQAPADTKGSSDQGFDLGSYMADNKEHIDKSTTPPEEQWSKAESLGQGILQGATAGYSDEIGGALGAMFEKAADAVGKGPNSGKSLKDLYTEYRDLQRKRNEAAETQNPGSYLAGNVAGGVGSAALAPEALAAKLGTLGGATALGAATGLGASNADLTNPNYENIKQATADTALGAGLGALGHGVGQVIQKGLNPEELEKGASQAATSLVKFNPQKEIPITYNQDTGRMAREFGKIRGTGTAALDAGAVPLTGGMEEVAGKAQSAIAQNFKDLQPVLESTQDKLEQNLEANVQKAGSLDEKVGDYVEDFFNKLPQTSKTPALKNMLIETYGPRIDEILQQEGNLSGLTGAKQKITADASSLMKSIYNSPDKISTENEATFLKGLGGVIRQHVEDLAGSVDPNAAKQIKTINGNISKLIDYQQAAFKQIKPTGGVMDALSAPTKLVTGYNPEQLAKAGTARALHGAAKALQTPAGELVQKAAPTLAKGAQNVVTNPFSQQTAQSLSPFKANNDQNYSDGGQVQNNDENNNTSNTAVIKGQGHAKATELSANLYNATDDSLKGVAQTLNQDPGLKFYGDHLNSAIDAGDSGEKNRAIFLIMQNPRSRKLVSPTEE